MSLGEYAAARHLSVVGDGNFSQFCKICGFSEDSTRTLICDMCKEAFHMSCCSPKINQYLFKMNGIYQYYKKKRKRREKKCLLVRRSSQSILDENYLKSTIFFEDKANLLWHMLQDKASLYNSGSN